MNEQKEEGTVNCYACSSPTIVYCFIDSKPYCPICKKNYKLSQAINIISAWDKPKGVIETT